MAPSHPPADELESSFHEGSGADLTAGLTARADEPSRRRLARHLGATAALALFVAVAPAGVVRGAGVVALSGVLAGLFAPFHECLHRTAFEGRERNERGARWIAPLFLASPTAYRAFHFAHHRHTQDPARDPEIAIAPEVVGRWPDGWPMRLARVSGMGIAVGKLVILAALAFGSDAVLDSVAGWLRPADRPRARAESRLLVAWAFGLSVLAVGSATAAAWVAAWWLSHVWLGWWLTTEHTGLPADVPILSRTRTVLSHPWVRWWTWNMGYHAEHHAWPAVPWFNLPELHARARSRLVHVHPTYLSVWRDPHLPRG